MKVKIDPFILMYIYVKIYVILFLRETYQVTGGCKVLVIKKIIIEIFQLDSSCYKCFV